MFRPGVRICQNCKDQFLIEPEDFDFYERIKVPPPTFCPWCRTQRRMVFGSEHNLFRKKDALTGKEVFSGYPQAAPVKIAVSVIIYASHGGRVRPRHLEIISCDKCYQAEAM